MSRNSPMNDIMNREPVTSAKEGYSGHRPGQIKKAHKIVSSHIHNLKLADHPCPTLLPTLPFRIIGLLLILRTRVQQTRDSEAE